MLISAVPELEIGSSGVGAGTGLDGAATTGTHSAVAMFTGTPFADLICIHHDILRMNISNITACTY